MTAQTGDQSAHQIGVLIVEDHRIFAEVLAARLARRPEIRWARVAVSLAEARVSVHQERPDVVLLDMNLDGEFGLDLIDTLKAMPNPPQALVLSAASTSDLVIRALTAGARGWVTKTARLETLCVAIRQVARGNIYLQPAVLRPVLEELLSRRSAPAGTGSFLEGVSPRQLEVLRCLVGGLSRAETAERLHISVNTVRTHVQVLLKRAGAHSALALASFAREQGVRAIDDGIAPPPPDGVAGLSRVGVPEPRPQS